MTRVLVSVFAIFWAGVGLAQNGPFLAHDGTVFSFQENQHGGVFTSIGGTEATALDVGDVLYLGRSCDAYSPEFGDGSWSRTDIGFLVQFSRLSLGFRDQLIDISEGDRCRI